jgi:hypothetical protein
MQVHSDDDDHRRNDLDLTANYNNASSVDDDSGGDDNDKRGGVHYHYPTSKYNDHSSVVHNHDARGDHYHKGGYYDGPAVYVNN